MAIVNHPSPQKIAPSTLRLHVLQNNIEFSLSYDYTQKPNFLPGDLGQEPDSGAKIKHQIELLRNKAILDGCEKSMKATVGSKVSQVLEDGKSILQVSQ